MISNEKNINKNILIHIFIHLILTFIISSLHLVLFDIFKF